MNGQKISEGIRNEIKNEVENLKSVGLCPALVVVAVGDDEASKAYAASKKKACEAVGIGFSEYSLKSETTEQELVSLIEKLNNDKAVNGIIVQLPLPKHINQHNVAVKISPQKDVDGLNPINFGLLSTGNAFFEPCTPAGAMELLKAYEISIEGKSCVVLGRSDIVGKPMAMLLLRENGTVTICHSKTKNLKEVCASADILVVAVGKPLFVTADMVKEGAVVVDVGINSYNGKICGDVDFENVKEKTSFITPVPKGCGPMTVAMLLKNCVNGCRLVAEG